MQPFPFAPWLWRDAAQLITEHEHDLPDDPRHERPDTGLIGYRVHAEDGVIGAVSEINARVPADCLLVDSDDRRVVLPVGTVHRVDHQRREVHVDRTRQQVSDSPEYDPDTFDSEEYRSRLGRYYADTYRQSPAR